MKKPPVFLIARCYSETTPESAENGDFSDSGTISTECGYDFRELIELMREHPEASSSHDTGPHTWYSTGFYVENSQDGTEREETIHWHRDNLPRHVKYWTKARNAADALQRRRNAQVST